MFQVRPGGRLWRVPFAEDEDGHFRGDRTQEGRSMSSKDRGFCCFSPE